MNFKIDRKNLDSFSKETLEFILKEGKDYLDYTLTESDKITNRAFSIIMLLFAILSGVVAYTFNKMILVESINIICLNFCLIFALVVLLFHLGCLIFVRPIMAKGRLPKTIALDKFLVIPKLSKEQNYVLFVIQEIENVQHKIDFNLTKNKKRQDKLSFVLVSIAIISVLYLIFGFFIII